MVLNAHHAAVAMIGRWVALAAPRVTPAPDGHINASFFIADGARAPCWLLQRVNRSVFGSPEAVMRNIELVLAGAASVTDAGIGLPALLSTPGGDRWVHDADGNLWRCWAVSPDLRSVSLVTVAAQAREAGRAFGAFARIATRLDPRTLVETIPGFHDSPARLVRFDNTIAHNLLGRAERAAGEIALVLQHRRLAGLLAGPLRSGSIPTRVAHNDAKIANVLFDQQDRATTVLDLDTVMPGTPLFDFGDLVRSSVSDAAEDATDLDEVEVRPEFYEALLAGYLSEAGSLLTRTERELLEPAGRVITWEQALRFLTDYLEGDTYFATAHRDHNLERARSQLALLASLESRREEFARLSLRS